MPTFSGKHLAIFGCGYVGPAVARCALTDGLRVTALTRNPASAIGLRVVDIDAVVAARAGGFDLRLFFIVIRPQCYRPLSGAGGARRRSYAGLGGCVKKRAAPGFLRPSHGRTRQCSVLTLTHVLRWSGLATPLYEAAA